MYLNKWIQLVKLPKMPKMSYKNIYNIINIVLLYTSKQIHVLSFIFPLKNLQTFPSVCAPWKTGSPEANDAFYKKCFVHYLNLGCDGLYKVKLASFFFFSRIFNIPKCNLTLLRGSTQYTMFSKVMSLWSLSLTVISQYQCLHNYSLGKCSASKTLGALYSKNKYLTCLIYLMERTLDWTSGNMGLTFSFANYWLCNLRKKHLIFLALVLSLAK